MRRGRPLSGGLATALREDAGQRAQRFLLPAAPRVAVNEQFGPLWSFAVQNDAGQPYLALLVPQVEDLGLKAELASDGRTVSVSARGILDRIRLPQPGTMNLPAVWRNA